MIKLKNILKEQGMEKPKQWLDTPGPGEMWRRFGQPMRGLGDKYSIPMQLKLDPTPQRISDTIMASAGTFQSTPEYVIAALQQIPAGSKDKIIQKVSDSNRIKRRGGIWKLLNKLMEEDFHIIYKKKKDYLFKDGSVNNELARIYSIEYNPYKEPWSLLTQDKSVYMKYAASVAAKTKKGINPIGTQLKDLGNK